MRIVELLQAKNPLQKVRMFACCILSEISVSRRLFYRYMEVCGPVSFSEMIIAALSSESGLNDRERIRKSLNDHSTYFQNVSIAIIAISTYISQAS